MNDERRKNRLTITEADYARLRELILRSRVSGVHSPWWLLVLEQQMDNAELVSSRHVPKDVVTMRSRVRVRVNDEQIPVEYTIQYPNEADLANGGISILTPLGTAVLGQRAGERVAWNLATGVNHYQIDSILHQPEAARHFDS